MTKEDLSQGAEDQESKQDAGSESEEGSEIEKAVYDDSDSEGSSKDDRISKLEKELADIKKGVAKGFSEKGREKAKEEEKTNPNYDDDIIEEVALTKYPEAEHVMDQAKDIAKKTGRSLLKVLREESWLMEKAKSITESNNAKKKVSSPSNQIEGEIDFSKIDKMSDEEQGNAIVKMSDKDYKKWQDYQRKKSGKPGRITL